MLKIAIISGVVIIIGSFILMCILQLRKERKEKKMILEQRLEHLLQSNKKRKNESSH
ncbi:MULTISPECIES: hypothetical protein [unclassified Lysinibacillus]|uniref:hypothetical protein n=1 Tax=unclassified Lysinibacillus TaxID=2636778 RepID=UPI002556F109|nr:MULTISPECIES: hypothetical protein [unclassified Lysinibacillus]MDM5249889.1 hypothetical protein [Lysinibacillus sp. G4S2]